MAFLTLIAPIVSLTYPIDKMNDGKAQAFNMWLKEYIFNALLQPFHLIIYFIFILYEIFLKKSKFNYLKNIITQDIKYFINNIHNTRGCFLFSG